MSVGETGWVRNTDFKVLVFAMIVDGVYLGCWHNTHDQNSILGTANRRKKAQLQFCRPIPKMSTKQAGAKSPSALKRVGKGYLKMKKKKALSTWYKRYCEIEPGVPLFKYYDHYIKGDDSNAARGVIVLEKSGGE